jgi:hypothetical protein
MVRRYRPPKCRASGGKVRFRTEETAQRWLGRLDARTRANGEAGLLGPNLPRTYFCRACGGWHLTRSTPALPVGRRKRR